MISETTFNKCILPLLGAELIEYTIRDNQKDRNQKYLS